MNQTISEGLKPYQLGEKLRALRLKKSMGLVELGKHTGLSAAMLSKLERGKLFPTLPTLLRIAMVFSVGLDFFFADQRKRHVVALVRKPERIRFPEQPRKQSVSYCFESLDFPANERKLSAYFAEFFPMAGDKMHYHQHLGVEFLYLMSGKMELTIGSDTCLLEQGDAIYFDSSVRHAYRREGKMRTTGIVITVP